MGGLHAHIYKLPVVDTEVFAKPFRIDIELKVIFAYVK